MNTTDYITSFLYGVAFGIPFCLAVGPIFFLLIQVGVNQGTSSALCIASGVVLADIVLINTTYFFIDKIRTIIIDNYVGIEWGCIIILLLMGIYTLMKKVSICESKKMLGNTTLFLFLYGFILDVFNPSNIFVWIGVNAKIINYDKGEHVLFYVAAVLTIAFLMMMLGVLSARIKIYLNERTLQRLNQFLGVIYIIIAIIIIINIHAIKLPAI